MRINSIFILAVLGTASLVVAQTQAAPPAPGRPVKERNHVYMRTGGEMGKWWRDPETAKKLQLSDGQVAQLDQIFYDHRMKLIDHGAEMEKQDLKLQSLLDADTPDEGQIGSQIDLVLAARGKLEREYTFMNLDLRKVLSLDQWRQLKSIRAERGTSDKVFFFQKRLDGGPHSGPMTAPPAPLPPPDVMEIMPIDPTL
jgi:Spy/CpxP family protein refolding chaperone